MVDHPGRAAQLWEGIFTTIPPHWESLGGYNFLCSYWVEGSCLRQFETHHEQDWRATGFVNGFCAMLVCVP